MDAFFHVYLLGGGRGKGSRSLRGGRGVGLSCKCMGGKRNGC